MINRYLKRLGELLHIATPLTTYVARHSWATIAKNEGVPVSIISEGLGHTSEKTTRIYLDSFTNDTMNRVNENVAAAVNDCMKRRGRVFICLYKTDEKLKTRLINQDTILKYSIKRFSFHLMVQR